MRTCGMPRFRSSPFITELRAAGPNVASASEPFVMMDRPGYRRGVNQRDTCAVEPKAYGAAARAV
jgi:hypothetical protein